MLRIPPQVSLGHPKEKWGWPTTQREMITLLPNIFPHKAISYVEAELDMVAAPQNFKKPHMVIINFMDFLHWPPKKTLYFTYSAPDVNFLALLWLNHMMTCAS